MEIFLVGGAVRDRLLDLPVRERDWVVVGASAAAMTRRGLRPVPGDFPVFVHPQTGEQYALARRECKIGPGHTGFAFDAGPDVTLEEDLRRRDLTINAMAESADGRLIDPYGGQRDLERGLLRHVSPAFVEDPLRLLRVARFAARLAHWGFRPTHGTHALMREVAASGELATLSAQRVWGETEQALAAPTPTRFFEVLRRCQALEGLFPELAAVLAPRAGHSPHGRGNEERPLRLLDAAARATENWGVRWAVFVVAATEEVAAASGTAKAVAALCRRLAVPSQARELAVLLADHVAQVCAARTPAQLLSLLEATDAFRRADRFDRFLVAAALLLGEKGTACTARLRDALQLTAAVSTRALYFAGQRGPALGAALRRARLVALAASAGRP